MNFPCEEVLLSLLDVAELIPTIELLVRVVKFNFACHLVIHSSHKQAVELIALFVEMNIISVLEFNFLVSVNVKSGRI